MRSLDVKNNADVISLFKKEGRLRCTGTFGIQNASRTTTTTGGQLSGGTGTTPSIGKHAFVESVIVTVDRSAVIGVTIKQGSWDTVGQIIWALTSNTSSSKGDVITIPVNTIVRDGGSYSVFAQQNDTGETAEFSSSWITYELTADLNTSANSNILICGDSVTWGTMGNDGNNIPYDGQNLWIFKLRNKIMDATGQMFRVINKGFGGSSSIDWKSAIRGGELDETAYSLMIVSLGLNDAGLIGVGGYTVQNFKDNLKLFAEHRNRYNKNSSILYLAPSPTDKTAWMGNIAAIRTAVSEVVTELGGSANKVYFTNQDLAYSLNATATADINVNNSERVAGGRVHPSGLGHDLIANYVYAQNAFLTTLK